MRKRGVFAFSDQPERGIGDAAGRNAGAPPIPAKTPREGRNPGPGPALQTLGPCGSLTI